MFTYIVFCSIYCSMDKKIRKPLWNNLIIKCITVAFAINIFSLVLLPGFFVLVFPILADVPKDNSLDFIGEKVDIPNTIHVHRTATGTSEEIPFEEYIKCVVASEMPSSFELEALKAQAVAARTYSLSKVVRSGTGGGPESHPNDPLCDSVHCQVYKSPEELRALKSDAWFNEGWLKICEAVDATEGQVMYYEGELVSQALFHSSSGGKTENSEDVFVSAVPYLRSVDSPYESEASHKDEKKTFTLTEFAQRLNGKYADRFTGNFTAGDIKILTQTSGGRVKELRVGNADYSGSEVRNALSLSSAHFNLAASGDYITLTTDGYGHGVGMSQYGANGMAKSGYDYIEILKHYYTGVLVVK